jgi:hypothetical protein
MMKSACYMGKKGFSRQQFTEYVMNQDGHLPYNPPVNEEAEELLDALIDDEFEDERSAVVFGVRRGKYFHNISVDTEESSHSPACSFDEPGYDMYFTACSTYLKNMDSYRGKTSRRGDRLFAMHAIAFDFDNHRFEREAAPSTVKKGIRKVERLLESYGITPTAFVSTGRGFHVYIAIRSVGCNLDGAKALYRKACTLIADRLDALDLGSLSLDRSTVGDATRLLRIPGSYNSKALVRARLAKCVHGKRYELADIVRQFSDEAPKKIARQKRKSSGKHFYGCVRVLHDIEKLIRIRKGQMTGTRNALVFSVSSYASAAYGKEGGRDYIRSLNMMFTEPLGEGELRKTYEQGCTYAFSKKALIRYAGISRKEMEKLHTLVDDDIRQERHDYRAWISKRMEFRSEDPLGYTDKQIRRAERNDFILKLHNQGYSDRDIAEIISSDQRFKPCCQKTVHRVIIGQTGKTPTLRECNEFSAARKEGKVSAPVLAASSAKVAVDQATERLVRLDNAETKSAEKNSHAEADSFSSDESAEKKNYMTYEMSIDERADKREDKMKTVQTRSENRSQQHEEFSKAPDIVRRIGLDSPEIWEKCKAS